MMTATITMIERKQNDQLEERVFVHVTTSDGVQHPPMEFADGVASDDIRRSVAAYAQAYEHDKNLRGDYESLVGQTIGG